MTLKKEREQTIYVTGEIRERILPVTIIVVKNIYERNQLFNYN